MFTDIAREQPGAAVTILVDGVAVVGRRDQTVAAALLANGYTRFRSTPVTGSPRAAYCHMGACFDCVVTIDGQPQRQSCMVELREGMQVSIDAPCQGAEPSRSEFASETAEVVVIGAGPAGLSAATELAEAGLAVLLLDEQPAPGGQVYRGVGRLEGKPEILRRALGRDYARGRPIAERFAASGARYWPAAFAWHVDSELRLWVSRGGRSCRLAPRALIAATGARERPLPVPGWTLPGVVTAGGLQVLLKTSSVVPGVPFVLAGTGPLVLLAAVQCLALGAVPVAILDTTPAGAFRAALPMLARALTAGGLGDLRKGAGWIARLRRSGIRIVRHVRRLAILGDEHVAGVRAETGRGVVEIPCRLVALHDGIVPETQLTGLAGCRMEWHARQRVFAPWTDEFGATSVSQLFVAGDGAAIEGARSAELAGRIAALAALARLGRLSPEERDRRARPLLARRRRSSAARPFLDRLYPPSGMIGELDDAVIVCRCEEVTAGMIRGAVAEGARTPDEVKGMTRCGMGSCQGRQCASTAVEIMAAVAGMQPAELGTFRVRAPLKPVRMAEIAAIEPAADER